MHIQRKITWITGIIENMLFGGVVFGWANIYPILKKEGYFSGQCEQENLTSVDDFCKSQFEYLSHVYTTTISCMLILALIIGLMFDKFGMWIVRTAIIFCSAISAVLIGTSTKNSSYLFFISFVLFGLFSSSATVLNSQIGSIFKKLRGSYSTTMSGAHNSGPILFLFFGYLYEKLNVKFSTLFYFYAGFLMIINIRTFTLTPKHKVPFEVPKGYKYGFFELLKNRKEHFQLNTKGNQDLNTSNSSSTSFKSCITRKYTITLFIAGGIFSIVTMIYVSSLNIFLPAVIGSNKMEHVRFYTDIMGFIQCGSLIFSPINSFLLDYFYSKFLTKGNTKYSRLMTVALGFYLSLSLLLLMNVANLIMIPGVQIFAMVMYTTSKVSFHGSCFYLFNSLYPAEHFGKMFGIFLLISGVMSAAMYPITLLITRKLKGDIFILNISLVVLTAISFIHPVVLNCNALHEKKTSIAKNKQGKVNDIQIDERD